MSTPTCCICQSATLIQRETLHTLIPLIGVLDVLLRQYSDKLQQRPPNQAPWRSIGDLFEVLRESHTVQPEGLAQGLTLAANIERHWLGEFESLCLNCGFMLITDAQHK